MNEKMMILKMLNEGKITVEESVQLLEACGNGYSLDDAIEKLKEIYACVKEKVEPISEEVVSAAKKAYKKAEPVIDETISKTKKAYEKAKPEVKKVVKKVKTQTKKVVNNIKK